MPERVQRPLRGVGLTLRLPCAFQALVMGLWLSRPGSAGFRTAHPRFRLLRGSLLLLILALGMASAATLMPFMYAQIPIATAISWAVLGQWPGAWVRLGMGIIMACGAASAWPNRRGRPAAPAARLQSAAAC